MSDPAVSVKAASDLAVPDLVESGGLERALVEVLAVEVGAPPQPPTLNPAGLPFGELAPPVFERLVAEVVLYVDGLGQVRVYGRSGQAQDGLDIVGGPVHDRSVYQVRRIERLTPSALRKAVVDYAGPPGTPPDRRRFQARRFVLAAACTPEDTRVEDELDALQREYHGDLDIGLYDGAELSWMLRHRGRLVAVMFGPAWAEAYCGYRVPEVDPVPAGRLLLDDPIDILGYTTVWRRAQAEESEQPLAAAEIYRDLAEQLRKRGMAPAAEPVDHRRRTALASGGQFAAALDLAVESALRAYDGARGEGAALGDARRYLEHLGDAEGAVLDVVDAVIGWAHNGYEVAPVAAALDQVAAAGHWSAPALAGRVAEQVVTDDDPRDDIDLLTPVLRRVAEAATGEEHIRLTACLADLQVRAGTDPEQAFAVLVRRALRYDLDEGLAALVLRRAGFALAQCGRADDAVDRYRQAVQQSSSAGLGADTRDALRALSALTDNPLGIGHNLNAVRAIASREGLLPGADGAALETLELLVDDKMPGAFAHARTWVRLERTNGALRDEWVARRRFGQVLDRATEHGRAVEQFIRSGTREAAVRAARAAEHVDTLRYLQPANLPRAQAAAAAVTRAQADALPDEDVDAVSAALLALARDAASTAAFGPTPSKYALGALAALGARLPIPVAQQMLDIVVPLLPRQPNTYRVVDEELVAALVGISRGTDRQLAGRAAVALVDAIGHGLASAADRAVSLDRDLPGLLPALRERAQAGDEDAVRVLASWDEWHSFMTQPTQRLLEALLKHPVGQPRANFPIGVLAPHAALLLRAALRGGDAQEVTDRLDAVVEHLLRWSEDSFDIAESRRTAADALAILADRLPAATRAGAFTRMLALHDDPGWNPHDLNTHASLHPLSSFRIDVGSEQLPLACLRTAAELAPDEAAVDDVVRRLRVALLQNRQDRHAAPLLERAIVALAPVTPLPLDQLAVHPEPAVRRAAAYSWGQQAAPDITVAEHLVKDADTTVRLQLAHAVARLTQTTGHPYGALIEQFRRDTSSAVRNVQASFSEAEPVAGRG